MAYDPWNSSPHRPTNVFAIIGFIIGITGFVLSWIPFVGIPIGHTLGILTIIFSAIGMARAGRSLSGRSIATIGLVLGILTVVFKSIPLLNLL